MELVMARIIIRELYLVKPFSIFLKEIYFLNVLYTKNKEYAIHLIIFRNYAKTIHISFFLSVIIAGIMRDSFGSFTPCIIVINCVTGLTVTLWTVEMLIIRKKKMQKRKEQRDSP